MGPFAKSTVYLALTQYLSAIIAIFYRMVLAKMIGPVGMGIYEQALAFLQTTVTLITAGIPASLSKLIAETKAQKNNDIENIMIAAKLLITCFSIISIVVLTFLSKFFKSKLFILILPTAILIGFSSIINGYFLGIQKTKPLQYSILIDSISTFIFFFVVQKSNLFLSIENKTKGAITAILIGELSSLIILINSYLKNRKSAKYKIYSLAELIKSTKNILTIALPISASQIINSISFSFKALLIPKCLHISGYTTSDAISIYGKTSGMAMPLLYFPAIFVMSLSSNIIPKISDVLSKQNINYAFILAEKAVTATACFSLLFMSFFIVLSKPIADLLFQGNNLEKIIACFSIGIPFFYIESISTAILRGIGNNKTPLLNSVCSFFIENIFIVFLVSKPHFGIYGYAISLITASAISTFISINSLEKKFDTKFSNINIIVKPILCCVIMAFILSKTYAYLELNGACRILNLGITFILGTTVYIAMARALGLVKIIKN